MLTTGFSEVPGSWGIIAMSVPRSGARRTTVGHVELPAVEDHLSMCRQGAFEEAEYGVRRH